MVVQAGALPLVLKEPERIEILSLVDIEDIFAGTEKFCEGRVGRTVVHISHNYYLDSGIFLFHLDCVVADCFSARSAEALRCVDSGTAAEEVAYIENEHLAVDGPPCSKDVASDIFTSASEHQFDRFAAYQGELVRTVEEAHINTAGIVRFKMYGLVMGATHSLLRSQILQHTHVLHLRHAYRNRKSSVCGGDCRENLTQILQLFIVFLGSPALCSGRGEFVVVRLGIVYSVVEILKIVEHYRVRHTGGASFRKYTKFNRFLSNLPFVMMDGLYSFLRPYVDMSVRSSYRRLRYVGLEKLPKDGAIIFAPNHCNGLMDPFGVLAIDHTPKVFVARADFFRKPWMVKFLTFLKIMPMHRRRDGLRNVLNNNEIIEKSVDVLAGGISFCILPEGTHRAKHGLLPLGKGISRIAVAACDRIGDRPVFIVPVGCEYGDYFRFRGSMLLSIGDPIDVSGYIHENPSKNEQEIFLGIKDLVSDAMKRQIVCIEDEENYEAVWEMAKIVSGSIPESRLLERREENRKVVAQLAALREKNPEVAEKLLSAAENYGRNCRGRHVSSLVTGSRRPLLNALGMTLLTLISLPLFVCSAAVSLPVWLPSEIAAARCEDSAFKNTLRCVISMLGWPVVFLAEVIVAFCLAPWFAALIGMVIFFPAPRFVYDCFELYRKTASSWRWLFSPRLREERKKLLDYFFSIFC